MKKSLSVLALCFTIVSCGGSGGGGSSSSSSGSPNPIGSSNNSLALGAISTIPIVNTNTGGTSVGHTSVKTEILASLVEKLEKLLAPSTPITGTTASMVLVNNTNDTVTVNGFSVDGDSTVQAHKDWYVNLNGCSTISPQNNCTFTVSTPTQSGSFVLTINTDHGNVSQLVSYSTDLSAINNFTYDNMKARIVKLPSQRSAFTIPVILGESFNTLQAVADNPAVVSTTLSCNGNVYPANNTCSIIGILYGTANSSSLNVKHKLAPAADTSVNFALVGTLASDPSVTINQPLGVNVTSVQSGNLVAPTSAIIMNLESTTTNIAQVPLLNNGNLGVTLQTIPSVSGFNIDASACTAPTLTTISALIGYCTVKVTTTVSQNTTATITIPYKDDKNNTGSVQFQIAVRVPNPLPSISFTSQGSLQNVALGTSSTLKVRVDNMGNVKFTNVNVISVLPNNGNNDFIINGSCSVLTSTSPCYYSIVFNPTAVESGSFAFGVTATYTNGNNESLTFTPLALPVSYSSFNSPAQLNLSVSNPGTGSTAGTIKYAIFANGRDSSIESVLVTNSGANPTVIDQILAPSAVTVLDQTYRSDACVIGQTLLTSTNKCYVYLKYGPKSQFETGTGSLVLYYAPQLGQQVSSTPLPIYYQAAFGANIVVVNVTAQNTNPSETPVTGDGITTPYAFYNNFNNQLKLTINYANSGLQPAAQFNLDLSSLPYTVLVDGSTNCPMNSVNSTMPPNLDPGQNCNLVLRMINPSLYQFLTMNGLMSLNIPGYSYTDSDVGFVHTTNPSYNGSSVISIQPTAFATVAAQASNTSTQVNSLYISRVVTFSVPSLTSGIDTSSLPITVKFLNMSGAISTVNPIDSSNNNSCQITSSSNSCTITVYAISGLSGSNYYYQYVAYPNGSNSSAGIYGRVMIPF